MAISSRGAIWRSLGLTFLSMPPSYALTTEIRATDQQGEIKAELFYRQSYRDRPNAYEQPCVQVSRLTIRRTGEVALAADLATSRVQIRDLYGNPENCLDQPVAESLAVQDLNGDGTAEVWFHLGDKNLYCCEATRVYEYDPEQAAYRATEQVWEDAGVALRYEGGQIPVFASGDRRFGWPFGPALAGSQQRQVNGFGGSGMPLQLWRYGLTGFEDVTLDYPGAVYAHAF
ncbi:MAG: hypothetical protein HC873_01825 [Leptolyngbyaceae cyanobacterium SL_1_1]|nr:hypothetical protein [Leptolyngbyaceae cyanobacterium SL_1_1]